MCRAQNEGGQRCASHAKEAVTSAETRFAASRSADDLQSLVEAHVQYASTPEGQEKARANVADGMPGPGGLDASMWDRIATDGEMLRERNRAVGAAIRTALAPGDAFHAQAAERWGTDGPEMPAGVRSERDLERFLDYEDQRAVATRVGIVNRRAKISALRRLRADIANGPVGWDAPEGVRQPRTQEEKEAWLSQLDSRIEDSRTVNTGHMRGLHKHNLRTARFDRDPINLNDTAGARIHQAAQEAHDSFESWTERWAHHHPQKAPSLASRILSRSA